MVFLCQDVHGQCVVFQCQAVHCQCVAFQCQAVQSVCGVSVSGCTLSVCGVSVSSGPGVFARPDEHGEGLHHREQLHSVERPAV